MKNLKTDQTQNVHNVRISLPLTNQQLWDMAETIVSNQKKASKLTEPVDWSSLKEDWFDWLEKCIFGNKA